MSAPFVVCEDGEEYTRRFERMLGQRFRFQRAGCFAEARAALAAGPIAGLLLDLDFRRCPAERLVDEQGREGARPGELGRLVSVQGILVLRALRAAGLTTPALLFADLDDPGQVAHLTASLAPLRVLSSRVGLDEIARHLQALAGASAAPDPR